MSSVEDFRERSDRQPVALGVDSMAPRILLLSIVNHNIEHNGASTVTRGLLQSLESPPLQASVECIPVLRQPRKWRQLAQGLSLLRSACSSLPSKVIFLRSREFREKVEACIQARSYDLVILNGSDLLWILEYLPESAPRMLIAHNIEHLLFDSQIRNLGRMYRPLDAWLTKDANRLRDFEIEGMRSVGNVIFLSSEDAEFARRNCPDLRSTVIPPLFDYMPNSVRTRRPGPVLQIGYVGDFGWWPNRQGLRWFASRVLPHVTRPVRINLFGPGSERAWRGDPRVVGHGVVEDMNRLWAQCDFLICPSFASGGVCVKIAEAAYNRIPVLANRHATRGLPLDSDPAIVLAEDPAEWIEFLNSTAAGDLAERRVSHAIASRFAVESYAAVLQDLVRSLVHPANLTQEARNARQQSH